MVSIPHTVHGLITLLFIIIPEFFISFQARSKGYYNLVGKIIAWSLVHGGPGGIFFSKTLYNAIAFNGTCKNAYLEDIADKDLNEKISTVCFY